MDLSRPVLPENLASMERVERTKSSVGKLSVLNTVWLCVCV